MIELSTGHLVAIIIGAMLTVFLPLHWYYEHQLDKLSKENDKLSKLVPLPYHADYSELERRIITELKPTPAINHYKDRSLAGKARVKARRASQRAERAAFDSFRPGMVTDLQREQASNYGNDVIAGRQVEDIINGHIVPPAMQDEVDRFFAGTPVEVRTYASEALRD